MANNQTFTLNIKALFDASDIKVKVGDIQKAFSNLKLPDNLKKNLNDSFTSLNKALSDFESRTAKGVKTKTDAKGLTTSMDNVIKEFTNVQKIAAQVRAELGDSVDLSKIIKLDSNTINRLTELQKQAKKLKEEIANINTGKLEKLSGLLTKIKGDKTSAKAEEAFQFFKEGDIEGALQKIDQLIAKQRQLESGAANRTGTITTNIEELTKIRTEMADAAQQAQEKTKALGQVTQEQANVAKAAFDKEVQSVNNANQSLAEYGNKASAASGQVNDLATNQVRLNTELDQVKSKIQYFFGLANSINLVKRAIRSAFETVKELDAAMTETAVVTDHTISDMWKKLPEYTKRANKLGVSTLAAYQSATLYYQQGLNDTQAGELSVETLKMARIAGLEAAEATDRMTNALRGFNMELNTIDAQRVDDVYSQLAAMSASNVDEISTAMTKVASLAHSANMEFETTAAFLAQIIETTRESAETAGTALKTVVARFSEVKKLYDLDELRGTDEEGQVVDVNKVSQALRTAGIDLNRYFLGEVGLDDIFMELASKWDSLTSVQQRYIATQAAGSRQQSRFIALMQDYARTQELVGAAYNAEGASARQFEKTQDSLQSKLERLKNAWNEFLMGITNSSIIKGAVDALTLLLNVINKITGAFGPAISGFLKFGVAAATIAGGKKAFSNGGIATKAIGALGNSPIGKVFGLGGNTNTQIVAAGTGFKAQVDAAGADFAAAVHGATAAQTVGQTSTPTAQTLTLGQRLSQFKANNIDPRKLDSYNAYQAYQNASPAERIRIASTSGIPQDPKAVPKTLFGGLGNKFYNTKLGNIARGSLAKLGFAGGDAAAVSGAAALAATIGTITVAAGAAAIAIKAMYDASPAGQLKQAKEYAKTIAETAENARKTADNYKDVQRNYKDYTDKINSSATISERQETIQDRNDYITSLLESDPNYAKYISSTIDEGGQFILTLDENALAAAVDKVAESAVQTAIASQVAQANVNVQQAQVYESRARALQGQINTAKLYGENIDPQLEAQLAYYQNQIASLNATAQNQISTAARQTLATTGLDSELANQLADVYASTYDSDEYQKKFNKYNLNAVTRLFGQGSRKQEYESIYGVGSADGLNRKQIADALAGYKIQQEQSKQLTNAAELISSGSYDKILDAIAGNIDLDEDWLNSEETQKQLESFAKALGKDTKVIEDQIKQSQKNRQEIRKTRESNIYERLLRSGEANEQNNIGNETAVDRYSQFLSTLDFEGIAAVEKITSQAETLLGDKLGEFMAELPNLYGTGQFGAVEELFSNINLDDPISAFAELQRYANDTTSAVGRYAEAIREANADLFTSSGLVKSFIASADYEGITEQLSKFVEENEAITADNINELAASCSDLATLIDEDVASAQALAEAFTLLETGALTFDQITDSLLKALDAGKGFETVIAEVKGWIDNFNQGNDLAEGADHVVSILEDLQKYVDNWEFGNEPVENIYDHLFGKGKYQDYLSTFTEGFDPEEAERYLTGQIQRFASLFENEGLGAIQELSAGGIPGLESLGNNLFSWDLSEIGSTTDAINQVATALGVTEEAAESLILAWQTHIPGLRKEWNDLAFSEQVTAFANSLGDTKVITEQELAGLAAATGHTVDEIKAKLAELATTNNIEIPVIVNFQDKDGNALTGDSLYKAFIKEFGTFSGTSTSGPEFAMDWGAELANATITGYEDGIQRYDPSQVLSYFTERGADATQAAELANRAISEVEGKFTKTVEIPVSYKVVEDGEEIWKADTKPITVEADTVEGLDAAVDAALQSAHYEAVADGIANQDLSGFEDNIDKVLTTAASSLTTKLSAACTAVDANGVNTAITNAGSNAAANLQSIIASTPFHGTVALTATTIGTSATGGIVKSYASGSEHFHVQPGTALTGEEDPEIVWNKEKGYAYITGQNGPEFQNLQPGDRVFNAQETKKILKNSSLSHGGIVESYAKGGWKLGDDSSGSGGGSGSGDKGNTKKESTWRNELDWLYDLMEDIAEYERQQTLIQAEYKSTLEDSTKKGLDLYNLTRKELINLETQRDAQEAAYYKRMQQLGELYQINQTKYQDYAYWNQKDQTLEINWDAIEAIQDKDTYDDVVDWLKRMETVQGQIDDAEKSLVDIDQQIQDLQQRYLQQYLDFQNRVLQAVVKQYQDQIDKLSELNGTLNDTNASILDSIQREIDLERQIRDNTDTESDIADMEARLAYLQRDTTGANATEIRQLQQQLSDARENYSDSLIDQAVDRLAQSNDDAAAARDKQVELMQAQLDYLQQSGGLWSEVDKLMAGGFGADGSLIRGSDLEKVLRNAEDYDAMSQAQRDNWANELILETNQVGAHILEMTKGLNVTAEQVRALSQKLVGALGGTPEHSYTAIKTEGAEKYATGGLNTYTGLAHLDGTPSAPEYVLNPEQTNAFLRLADVLPSIMGGDSIGGTTYGGNIYLNLDMHVDEIGSDYDVDRIADRVKDIIYDASSYRNVNTLNFIR